MDLLSQHEAFLRAIFDAPADDTPRLVYADFLQENGDEDRAALIRWQCGHAEKPATAAAGADKSWRGFPPPPPVLDLTLAQLLDPAALRRTAVEAHPEYFAATAVQLSGGRIASAEPFDALFGLAALARVTDLLLSGDEVPDRAEPEFTTYTLSPVVTPAGVAALAQHRGLRRVRVLDLRNNDLDNDAARALVKSPFLDNLRWLRLLEGNRLRGKVWQQVIGRFGEDVVG